ncbi:MAG: aerobic C4-dicarboxylate transport protein [Mycobacterium sp.]|nr:aerobic C4-dicarboxylate transport protein [Mycobacterium sp.]
MALGTCAATRQQPLKTVVRPRTPLYTRLYFQVITGITLGVLLGHFYPHTGAAMQPLGDGFIKLIRMIIAPIIFTTVAVGIGKMGAMKDVGRIGFKALLYFEVVSTVALFIGLVVVNVLKPGVGMNVDPNTIDATAVAAYTSGGKSLGTVSFLMNVIPTTVVDAFARGEILQVLLFSILFGLALLQAGGRAAHLLRTVDELSHALFGVVGILMRLAPIGAFGAMAYTIGRYGVASLLPLAWLMAGVYITCLVFIIVVLGTIARISGFSLWKFIRYIREEIFIVLGTSTSETVLPRMMAKLEHLGCSKPVVGLVIPAGYSFNLDGTSIYMTMAAIFLAQAMNIQLSIWHQLGILAILMLTSKGAAAVTGGGFITLAATLAATGTIPVAGMALILGIDRFMSEARSITNLIGNGVATLAVARWEGALDTERLTRILGETGPPEVHALDEAEGTADKDALELETA